jgi:hypothetical protein
MLIIQDRIQDETINALVSRTHAQCYISWS